MYGLEEKEAGRRQVNSAFIKYNMREVLGGEGAAMVFSAAPSELIHKENQNMYEHAERAEREARECAGLRWTLEDVPPPDFAIIHDESDLSLRAELCVFIRPLSGASTGTDLKDVRLRGPPRRTIEEARKDGYEMKREAFRTAAQDANMVSVRRTVAELNKTEWTSADLAKDANETQDSERRLPELMLATKAEKFKEHEKSITTLREWIYEKREDAIAKYVPSGPNWSVAGNNTAVPKLPGVWYVHERQTEDGKHVSWLFFNASTGKYYRQLVAEGPSCGWIQQGEPHNPVEHTMTLQHGSTCLPAAGGRKDALAVALPELARTGNLLKQPLPFLDKPAALFLLVDGMRGSDQAAKFCAQRFHTQLLPRLSARATELEDHELTTILGDAVKTLDRQLLESMARYAGCGLAIALLIGRRLVVATIGAVRAILCRTEEPPTSKAKASSSSSKLTKWTTHALATNTVEELEVEYRRVIQAGGALDFALTGRMESTSASTEALAEVPEGPERTLARICRAVHPFAVLDLRSPDLAGGVDAVRKASEGLLEEQAGSGADPKFRAAFEQRVKDAAAVVEAMLGIDVYGTQILADLFHGLDEDGGIPTAERVTGMFGVEAGCADAVVQAACDRRYRNLLLQLQQVSQGRDREIIACAFRILAESAETATRAQPLWTPTDRHVKVTRALGFRDMKMPRSLVGNDLAFEVLRLEPGPCALVLLTDGARGVTDEFVGEACALHPGRPRALATCLTTEATRGGNTEAVGAMALYINVDSGALDAEVGTPASSSSGSSDAKKRRVGDAAGAGAKGTMSQNSKPRIRASHLLMKFAGLKEADPNARSQAQPTRTQVQAERELVEVLKVLANTDQKHISAKFAEFVKRKSDCKSADSGMLADMGWISPGQWGKEFDAAAFDLAAGTLSDIIVTPRGVHIIHRLA